MCDQNILNLSASYIENILNCYASELNYHTSSVEALHIKSQVIFFFYDNIQLFFSFLTFTLLFWFVIDLVIKLLLKFWQLSFESFLPLGKVLVFVDQKVSVKASR